MSIWKEVRYKDGTEALEAEIVFKSFLQAMAFLHEATPYIDSIDHHPTWTNVYNRLHIILQTHDAANTITAKDRALALYLEKIFTEKYV